ncbi:MAG: hypothetical protein MO846_09785 [Candidatus Devosia symbiotica]|nr:hypothetical protein [Candidatus Devosia symbiotica]
MPLPLLVLPLSYQLLNSTVLTPASTVLQPPVVANRPVAEQADIVAESEQVITSADKVAAAPKPAAIDADIVLGLADDTMMTTGLAGASAPIRSPSQNNLQMRSESVAMPTPAALTKAGSVIGGQLTQPSGDEFTSFDEQ